MLADYPLSNVKIWVEKLGLLPIPLFSNQEDKKQFVLLNGSKGNFCLDLENVQELGDQTRSFAWSANVGHYILTCPR
jgi:adenine-specific DNA-methyltransferase